MLSLLQLVMALVQLVLRSMLTSLCLLLLLLLLPLLPLLRLLLLPLLLPLLPLLLLPLHAWQQLLLCQLHLFHPLVPKALTLHEALAGFLRLFCLFRSAPAPRTPRDSQLRLVVLRCLPSLALLPRGVCSLPTEKVFPRLPLR